MKISYIKVRTYSVLALLSLHLTACMSLPSPEVWETNAVDYGKKVGDLMQHRHLHDRDSYEGNGYYAYTHSVKSVLYSHYEVGRKMVSLCDSTGGRLVEPDFIPVRVGPKQNYISKGCLREDFGDFIFTLHFTGRGQNLEEYIVFSVFQSYEGEATEGFKRVARINGFNW